jgi:CubicO group peptidase (beta-lactamase class C family)
MQYPLVTTPGTRFEMAQENFQLVGLVTERATGTSLQRLMSERMWKKIGASDAAFQLDRPGGVARVMCCMRATARDWARIGVLVLNDGRWGKEQVLPAGWVKTMATPSARNPNYGLGLWLGSPYVQRRTYFEGQPGPIYQSEPFEAPDVRMMEGGGFRTIWVVPSRELMILRLGEQVPDWDHAYLVNTIVRGIGKR